jgi:ppGpp synthetase/RelA/SpoT-type nucleotidyltranferase
VAEKKFPTSEEYQKYIAAYQEEIGAYKTYAKALKYVLEKACRVSIPEAIVQARPKDVISFAGKWVRKFDKYPNPIRDMTDLCGARVIVQTLEQVNAICQFIEYNFVILDKDDKGFNLGESTFGYRDIHYLIRLNEERARIIGFSSDDRKTIGNRIAELQVRTWVQHAWADTLHDRLYKAPLQLSQETKRDGALLAAIMEDGDRAFSRLSIELDGMAANYTAYAVLEDVKKEVEIQELILQNEPEDSPKRPMFALRLSRLIAPGGNYDRVIGLLDGYKDLQEPIRPELLLELGFALCKSNRKDPSSTPYHQGMSYLQDVIDLVTNTGLDAVSNPRKQDSLRARAHYRLAWAWEAIDGEELEALQNYRLAVEIEPGNPYYLAGQLSYEIYCSRGSSLIQTMRGTVQTAIELCKSHVLAGTELPYAFFTAGRLSLLLEEDSDSKGTTSIGWYARGLRDLFSGKSYCHPDLLDDELQWLKRISFGRSPSENQTWIRRLVTVSQEYQKFNVEKVHSGIDTKLITSPKVLIVAGGAATIIEDDLDKIKLLLRAALRDFQGTVISGGTMSGVPGCVGEVAEQLKNENSKKFLLIGYVPNYLPIDAPMDKRYDDHIRVGKSTFSADQILKNWEDFLAQEIKPEEILLLGFGGGKISSIEYRIALALGANVAVVVSSGGEADRLLKDPVWDGVKNLLHLPFDIASAMAFVSPKSQDYAKPDKEEYERLEKMAKAFHANYVMASASTLPPNMRDWVRLEETYKKASLEQANYSVEILRAAGFGVRPSKKPVLIKFSDQEEIEIMASLEHGRWNIERLQDGWRPGKKRDNTKKLHNCLVPWNELTAEFRDYDLKAVSAYPRILSKAGLEIFRLEDQKQRFENTKTLLGFFE